MKIFLEFFSWIWGCNGLLWIEGTKGLRLRTTDLRFALSSSGPASEGFNLYEAKCGSRTDSPRAYYHTLQSFSVRGTTTELRIYYKSPIGSRFWTIYRLILLKLIKVGLLQSEISFNSNSASMILCLLKAENTALKKQYSSQ